MHRNGVNRFVFIIYNLEFPTSLAIILKWNLKYKVRNAMGNSHVQDSGVCWETKSTFAKLPKFIKFMLNIEVDLISIYSQMIVLES